MKIKSTTLHKWAIAYSNIVDYIEDTWFQWKHKQLYGYYQWEPEMRNDDRWRSLLRNMPDLTEWEIEDTHITVHGVDKEGKRIFENIPIEEFVNEFEYPDLELLSRGHYWDGPLTGWALYNNDIVYIDCICDHEGDDSNDPLWGLREYKLHELTEEQKIEYAVRHMILENLSQYSPENGLTLHPEFEDKQAYEKYMEEFYANEKQHRPEGDYDYTKGKVVGVYADHQFKNNMQPRFK